MTDEQNEEQPQRQSTALAVQRMTPEHWTMIKEQSQTLEAAGKGTQILPKGIHNRYQVAAVLQKGYELGFAPMYSLEMVTLIEGKPVVLSQALLALIQNRLGRRAVVPLERTDEKCTLRFSDPSDPDMPPLEVTWTIDDAIRAKLVKERSAWEKYPRAMLYWRALAEGARVYFADVVAGLYLPDEVGIPYDIDSAGNLIIDHEALEREEAPEQRTTDIADAEFVETGEAPVKHNRQDLMKEMESALRELAETRGKGEQWLFVLRQVASDLHLEAKGPSTLGDQDLIKVTEEAREQIQKLQEATAEEAPQTVTESVSEQTDEVVPEPEEAPADMTW